MRREYESSLSWRVTAPLRAAKRAVRPPSPPGPPPPPPLSAGTHDLWLRTFWDEQLSPIEEACAGAGPEAFGLFRELDAGVWALLLTQEQTVYPQIAAVLPEMPAPELQVIWNGTSGLELAAQSSAFYERLREIQHTHGAQPLEHTRVLDFGCGWGRLTRFLARDVEPGRLFGCDPSPILDVARQNRVPATLVASEFVPERVPFDERFDLAYAFSVFTHLSEHAHEASLNALHAAIRPGGLLAATIRPPEYLRVSPLLHPALAELGPEPAARLAEPRYLYAPHEQLPLNYDERRERSYGETVITLAYIRERWGERFELLDVRVSAVDPQQIVLVLRRR